MPAYFSMPDFRFFHVQNGSKEGGNPWTRTNETWPYQRRLSFLEVGACLGMLPRMSHTGTKWLQMDSEDFAEVGLSDEFMTPIC